MKIYDLVTGESENNTERRPSPDPLYEDDVLIEATLLDLLHYAFFSTTALLIDLRTSMYFDEGNTGVLVCREVIEITLEQNFAHRVWMFGDSRVREVANGFELLFPLAEGKLQIRAKKLQFYVATVQNIGSISASLDDGIAGYLQTTPHWESELEIVAASSRA